MKLVSIKCPSCGASAEVDEYTKSFTCIYCKTTSLIEKEERNSSYNETKMNKAEIFIREHKDYLNASEQYQSIANNDPKDPRPWYGLIRCITQDFNLKLYLEVPGYEPIWQKNMEYRLMNCYEKYMFLEHKEEFKNDFDHKFNEYIQTNKSEYETLTNTKAKEDSVEIEFNEDNKYIESISTNDKIISFDDLKDIFELMNDKLNHYMAIDAAEEERNKLWGYRDKEYTFKNSMSHVKFNVSFIDNSDIVIDNFEEFKKVYETRLKEIKNMYVDFYLSYSKLCPCEDEDRENISQYIKLDIRENRLNIDLKINSKDDKINDIYIKLKNMINNAPKKYDSIIKNKGRIETIVSLGYGYVLSILITTCLVFIEPVKELMTSTYILFFIASTILAFIIGEFISAILLESKYKTLMPEKIYAGRSSNGKRRYKYDIDKYIQTCEISIGKNINNFANRLYIKNTYEKMKKIVLIEILIAIIISIIIVLI